MTAELIAYGNRLGYLHCVDCTTEHDTEPPYHSDNPALDGETCDACGRDIRQAAASPDSRRRHREYRLVHVAPDNWHAYNLETRVRLTTGTTEQQVRRTVDRYLDRKE